jgi:hypothetical protein
MLSAELHYVVLLRGWTKLLGLASLRSRVYFWYRPIQNWLLLHKLTGLTTIRADWCGTHEMCAKGGCFVLSQLAWLARLLFRSSSSSHFCSCLNPTRFNFLQLRRAVHHKHAYTIQLSPVQWFVYARYQKQNSKLLLSNQILNNRMKWKVDGNANACMVPSSFILETSFHELHAVIFNW